MIPNYGVTNAPRNLNTMWSMYPYNMTSNFGMETQHFTLPSYATPLQAYLTRDLENPMNISQWNPMLYGFNLGNNNNADLMAQLTLQQTGALAYSQGVRDRLAISLRSAVSTLTGMKSSLENILKSDKLTDSQKERVQAVIDETNEMIARIKKMVGNTDITVEDVEALQGEVLELQKKATGLAEDITKEIKEGKESSETEEAEESSDSNDTSTDNNDKKSKEDKALEFAMTQVAHKIDKAIDSCGTNYDSDENGLLPVMKNNVNKDTVLELFDAWDKTYSQVSDYKDDSDGFIESLMDDCEGDQKEEIAIILIDALEQRAYEKGIDVKNEIAAARSSVKSNFWGWRNDDKIQTAVNALRQKVQTGETEKTETSHKKAEEKKTTSEAKKAEAKAKKQEKIEAKKQEFLDDMKEILERDDIEALPAGLEVVTDSNGNFKGFKIRIKGKNYEGKDYLDLVKKLEKDGQKLPIK